MLYWVGSEQSCEIKTLNIIIPILEMRKRMKTLPKVNSYVSVQFSSVAQSCPTLCDPMNRSTPGLPVHHQLLEFTQTHVHRVGDAIQPSHPLSSPSPPAPSPSQHQGLLAEQKSGQSSRWVASCIQAPLRAGTVSKDQIPIWQISYSFIPWTPWCPRSP